MQVSLNIPTVTIADSKAESIAHSMRLLMLSAMPLLAESITIHLDAKGRFSIRLHGEEVGHVDTGFQFTAPDRCGHVDMTPTWESVFPIYLEAAMRGVPEAKQELQRMARLADKYMKGTK